MDIKKTALTKDYQHLGIVLIIILSFFILIVMTKYIDDAKKSAFIADKMMNLTCDQIYNRSTGISVDNMRTIGDHQKYLMLYMRKCLTNCCQVPEKNGI